MVKDTRRIAAPDNCLSPDVYKKKNESDIIVDKKGKRKDGRKEKELKPMSLEVGIVPSVTGSAYLESGNTKIMCSIVGPRDVLNKTDSATKGQLYCEFKYAMFSCSKRQSYMPTDEEVLISKSIQDALEPVILLHKFPKSRLDIFICVLENDGSVISSAITCAGAALSNAGVEMYDLPIGCSLVHCDSKFLVNPTTDEENYSKCQDFVSINIAMMVEYKSQIIFMENSGPINPVLLSQSMEILQSSCQQIVTNIRMCLKNHVKEMNADQLDEPNKGTLGKQMLAQVKLFQPVKYLRTFLENNIRTDGRGLTEFRPVLIDVGSINTANGSALVRLGGSSVLCGIKAELTNPLQSSPDKGFFVPNVTLTSLCSNRFVPGPPAEQAQVYSQMIMDLWQNSSFLDQVKLCIVPNNLVWCLFADMICLSYDGNILDACIYSLMSALKNTKLPKVSVNEVSNQIEVDDTLIDLEINNFVFSATFSILNDCAIADPNLEEESLSSSSVTVFLNDNLESILHSYGPVKEKQLSNCIDTSKARYLEMKELFKNLN